MPPRQQLQQQLQQQIQQQLQQQPILPPLRTDNQVMQRVMGLIFAEAVGIFVLYITCKTVLGIDIFDFSTPRGRWIGYGIAALALYFFYVGIMEGGSSELGVSAVYAPNDSRRARVEAEIMSRESRASLFG